MNLTEEVGKHKPKDANDRPNNQRCCNVAIGSTLAIKKQPEPAEKSGHSDYRCPERGENPKSKERKHACKYNCAKYGA